MSVDIAIYLPSLMGGGAEKIAVILANGMAERGFSVDLVLVKAEGTYLKDVAQNVRIVNLSVNRVITSLPNLIRYLRCEKPKAMLSLLNHANVIAVMAKILARVNTRLIVSVHSNTSISYTNTTSFRGKVVLPLMRWAYRKADGIVTVSKGVGDDLAKMINLSRERISVIYNPVVTQELLEKAVIPVEHSWLKPDSPPLILGVGRLTKAKDFPTLIHAIAKVRRQHNCRLIILGEGELRSELEALVQELNMQDCVQLPGFVENPFAWMARTQLFVFSSAWEGFGNVLVEAMACGARVVSTNCPSGPSEILEGGKWGDLVPVGDPETLSVSILQALNSSTKVDASIRAMEFTPDLIIGQYIQVLMPEQVSNDDIRH